jgi:hypothetical protein
MNRKTLKPAVVWSRELRTSTKGRPGVARNVEVTIIKLYGIVGNDVRCKTVSTGLLRAGWANRDDSERKGKNHQDEEQGPQVMWMRSADRSKCSHNGALAPGSHSTSPKVAKSHKPFKSVETNRGYIRRLAPPEYPGTAQSERS